MYILCTRSSGAFASFSTQATLLVLYDIRNSDFRVLVHCMYCANMGKRGKCLTFKNDILDELDKGAAVTSMAVKYNVPKSTICA